MIVSNRIYITVALILRALLTEALPQVHQGGLQEYHRGYQGPQRAQRGQHDRSRPQLQNGPKGVEESDISQIEQGSQRGQYQEFQQQEGSQIHPGARRQEFQQHQVQEGTHFQELEEQQGYPQVTQHQGSQIHKGARHNEVQQQQESQTQQGAQYQEFQQHQVSQIHQGAAHQAIQEQQESQIQQGTQNQEFQQHPESQVHQGARHHEEQEQQEFQTHQGAQYQEFQQHQRPQVHQTVQYQELKPQQQLPAQHIGQYHEFKGVHPGATHQEIQEQQESQIQQGTQYQEFQQHPGSQVDQGARHHKVQEQQESQTHQGAQYQEFQQYQRPQVHQTGQYQKLKLQQQLPAQHIGQYHEFQGVHPGARHQEYQGLPGSQQSEYQEFQPQQVSQIQQGSRYQELQRQGPQVRPGAQYQEVQPHQVPHVQQGTQYQKFPGHYVGRLAPQYQEFQGHPGARGPHRYYYYHDGRRYYPQHHEWQRGYHQYQKPDYPVVYPSSPEFPYPPEHPDYQAAFTAYSQNQPHFYKSDGSKVKFTYIPLKNSRDSKIIIPGPGDTSNIKYVRISQDGDETSDENPGKEIIETVPSQIQMNEDSSANQQKNYQEHGQVVSTASASATATSSGSNTAASTSATPSNGPDSKRGKHKRKHGHRHSHKHRVAGSEDNRGETKNTGGRHKHHKHPNKNVQSDSKQDTLNSKEQIVTVISKETEPIASSITKTDKEEPVVETLNKPHEKPYHERRKLDSHKQQDNEQIDISSDLRSQNVDVKVDLGKKYNEEVIVKESDKSNNRKSDTKQIAIESSNKGNKHRKHKHESQIEKAEQSGTDSDLSFQTTEVKIYSDRGYVQDESVNDSKIQTTIESASQQSGEKLSDPERKQTEVSRQSENNSDVRSQDAEQQESTATESLNEADRNQETFEQQSEFETNPDLRSQNTETVLTYTEQQNTQDESEYGVTKCKKQSSTESLNQQYIEETGGPYGQQSEFEQSETNTDLKSQDSENIAYSDQQQNQNESDPIINVEGYISRDIIGKSDNEKEIEDFNTDEVQSEQQNYGDDYIIAENETNSQENDYLENTSNNNSGIIAETTVVNENNKDSNGPETVESYIPCEQDDNSQTVTAVIDAQSKTTQNNKQDKTPGKVLFESKKDTSAQEIDPAYEDEDPEYSTFDAYNNIENYAAAYTIAKVIAKNGLHGHDGVKKVFEDPAVKVYVKPLVQQFLPYFLHLKDIVEKFHKVPK